MKDKPKIVNSTLAAQLTKILEDQIYREVWKVGEKIPSEGELVKTYGVSRNTLREAIHHLALTGVLDIRPGDGTYVRSRTVFDAMLNKRLEKEDVSILLEVRGLIEPSLAALAAERRTEEELEHLLELEEALERSYEQGDDDYFDKDFAFHSYLAEICHNSLLRDLYCAIIKVHTPFLKQALPGFLGNDITPNHRTLCEFIRRQQADEAKKLSEGLIAREKKAVLHQEEA